MTTAETEAGVKTQMYVSETPPSQAEYEPVENKDDGVHKPRGGLWSSTLRDGTSGWLDWVLAESFYTRDEVVWLLYPEDDVDVLTIDSEADLHAALDEYQRQDDRATIALQSQTFAPLDFEAMAEDYDAIRLTEEGQWDTRFSKPGLYGWDSECYLWFRWAFEDISEHRPITDYIDD